MTLNVRAMVPPADRRSNRSSSPVAMQINDVGANSDDASLTTASARMIGTKEAEQVPLLFSLARCGDEKALEAELSALAAKGLLPAMINQKNGSGISPLHLAAVYGHEKAVTCLLRHKANVDIADEENGDTPLHLAVLMGHVPVATALVRAGANLCKKNKEDMMPVSYTRSYSHSILHGDQKRWSGAGNEMVERMLQHFPTFRSVSIHWRDPVIMTRKADARASVIDKNNKTILHYAARYGRSSDSIRRLLSCWAACGNVLDEKEDYNSFLAEAVDAGNAEAVKAVRTFSFLPPDQPSNYATLLSCALLAGGAQADDVSSRSREVLQELLELGIPSGFEDQSRLTINALIMAHLRDELMKSSSDHPGGGQAVCPLYTNKLSVTDVEYFESSLPIYLPLYAKRYLAFEFMLERVPGLTLNQWDEKHKRTCLHWAVEHRRPDIVAKLLRMGATAASPSPCIEDIKGKTALQRAFESKQEEVRRQMLETGPAFKAHEEKLYRDRDVYVGVVNAILVGAVLVASVTFGGWLQPPVPSSAEFSRLTSKVFWAANSLAFFLAVATVFVTVGALVPTPKKYVGGIVKQLEGAMVLAAHNLALSLILVLTAFSAAGFAAIPDEQYHAYQASMTRTICVGIALCTATKVSFFYQLYNLVGCSLDSLVQCLPCRPLLSRCARGPAALDSRVDFSTHDEYPINLPTFKVHDVLNQPVTICARQHAICGFYWSTPRIATRYE